MACLVKRFAPVRQAVAHLLLAPGLEGILCSYDDLKSPLNTMHGVGHNNNKYALIDEPVLIKSFTWKGETSITYTLNYSEMHIVSSGAEEEQYLYLSKDCSQVCHLSEKDIVHEASGIGSLVRPANGVFDIVVMTHPLKTPSFKRLLPNLVPQDVKDALLLAFLKEEMSTRMARLTEDAIRVEKKAMESINAKKRASQRDKCVCVCVEGIGSRG